MTLCPEFSDKRISSFLVLGLGVFCVCGFFGVWDFLFLFCFSYSVNDNYMEGELAYNITISKKDEGRGELLCLSGQTCYTCYLVHTHGGFKMTAATAMATPSHHFLHSVMAFQSTALGFLTQQASS